ncbi:mechanosensitive ion channel family protein [Desulfomonile tiedjei]|uniref:Small-conductance mechanosensitive channel n=1 Tax=Desulfomonile tiedjei (strain ATCC 49306 / DSM 6799 / DCB-1) TaxID=706587 RepID=I4C6F1_DESTA|nr:mechanosensitive ion channel family protein [Desulfomonile tiedjei]AFM25142.1 small-conductance mechanosensitive channel [Desulfomonile tiedjei DSM 6799]
MGRVIYRTVACIAIVTLLSVILFPICFVAYSSDEEIAASALQGEKKNQKKPTDAAALPEKIVSIHTEKIDDTAANLENSVNGAKKFATSILGNWINKPVIFGITLWKVAAMAVIIVCVIIVQALARTMRKNLKERWSRKNGAWKAAIFDAMQAPLSLLIWVYGLYAAFLPISSVFRSANGTNVVHSAVRNVTDVLATIALIWFLYGLVNLTELRAKRWLLISDKRIPPTLVGVTFKIMRFLVIAVAVLIMVRNLTGLDVAPLIASLGLGGLAVALAAKDSVANFFGTLTIVFDKPFQVGERIVIENYDGTVESVGFRSTRLRSSSENTLITIPNQKIINAAVNNMDQRPFLHWTTQLPLSLHSTPAQIEKAIDIIRSILENHEGLNSNMPPRVFFQGLKDAGMIIDVHAWYHPAQWWDYQAWVHRTYLEILKRFEAEGITFAVSPKTVYLADRDYLVQNMLNISKSSTEARIPSE